MLRRLIFCRLLRRHGERGVGHKHREGRVFRFEYCVDCRALLAGETFDGRYPVPR